MNGLDILAIVLLSLVVVPFAVGMRCAWLGDHRYRYDRDRRRRVKFIMWSMLGVMAVLMFGFLACVLTGINKDSGAWLAACHARGGVNMDGHCFPKGTKEIHVP